MAAAAAARESSYAAMSSGVRVMEVGWRRSMVGLGCWWCGVGGSGGVGCWGEGMRGGGGEFRDVA